MNMEKEIVFANILEQVRTTAKEQGNCITDEQVKDAFAEMNLAQEQLDLVYSYLKEHKIGIGEPVNADDYLTEEEKNYLEEYLVSVRTLAKVSAGEKQAITFSAMAGDKDAQNRLIELYLEEVTDIAKLYAGQGVYMEDLIGEGNITLSVGVGMLGCLEKAEEADGMLVNMIMNAMESYITENAEAEKADLKIVAKVNKVTDLAKSMAEDLQRKVTPKELAEETGLSLKAIRDAIRISGDNIEYLENVNDGK